MQLYNSITVMICHVLPNFSHVGLGTAIRNMSRPVSSIGVLGLTEDATVFTKT